MNVNQGPSGFGAGQFMGFPPNQQQQPGGFPQGNPPVHMHGAPIQSQAIMTTLPNGSIIVQQRTIPSPGSNFLLGTNMMGPGNIRYHNTGVDVRLQNLLNFLLGSNFGTFDVDRFEEMLNGSQGLDKETLESFTVVKYDKEKSKNLDSELKKCAICLEEFDDGEDVKFLLCLHRFHQACIDPWMEKHTTCPICKKDYSDLDQGDHE